MLGGDVGADGIGIPGGRTHAVGGDENSALKKDIIVYRYESGVRATTPADVESGRLLEESTGDVAGDARAAHRSSLPPYSPSFGKRSSAMFSRISASIDRSSDGRACFLPGNSAQPWKTPLASNSVECGVHAEDP